MQNWLINPLAYKKRHQTSSSRYSLCMHLYSLINTLIIDLYVSLAYGSMNINSKQVLLITNFCYDILWQREACNLYFVLLWPCIHLSTLYVCVKPTEMFSSIDYEAVKYTIYKYWGLVLDSTRSVAKNLELILARKRSMFFSDKILKNSIQVWMSFEQNTVWLHSFPFIVPPSVIIKW